MNINEEFKVADVVSQNIKAADIFKKYGIDFCCGGGISIAKACERSNANLNQLLFDLSNMDNQLLFGQNFIKWELDFLIDFIVNTHHLYVMEAFDLLDDYTSKVAKVHGEHHPPIYEIVHLYSVLKQELLLHMKKEEQILFPYIKHMVQFSRENCPLTKSNFGTIQNPIQMMQLEHENAGNLLKEIAALSMNYTTPEWACNTFKALYAKLDEFEQDLHLHVHLENNILFPKALEMERNFQILN